MDKVLETLLDCFVMVGFDELTPNEKWYKLSQEQRDEIRELFKGDDK